MRFYFFIFLFAPTVLYATTNFGEWGVDCTTDDFFIQLNKKPSPLIVNDNQIVISVHSTENISGSIDIYFDKTLDLGSGGMNFKWGNVSTEVKIAELKIADNNANFKWFGFFDKANLTYFWINDPDFVQSYAKDGLIKMHKCK